MTSLLVVVARTMSPVFLHQGWSVVASTQPAVKHFLSQCPPDQVFLHQGNGVDIVFWGLYRHTINFLQFAMIFAAMYMYEYTCVCVVNF